MVSCLSVLSLSLFAHQTQAASAAFDPNGQWLFGDWNGQRTALQEQGYKFSADYTGEFAGVLDSKQHSSHGSEFTGQLALGTNFDLNKILGWQDTEAQITVTYRDGQSLSQTADGLQGHQSSVQEVWGRGQTWRLTDLWIKKKFLDQALDIKVGRFGEGEDFNSFACDFQNLALCGSQVGNWVGDQWYNWPVSQWALRVKYNLQPDLYAQIGAYEYNPENLQRGKGF
ncbi:MAG: carbohydrate porin, partial [Acinetobacter sp.]